MNDYKTWKEAILDVLTDAEQPLHYVEIAVRIGQEGKRDLCDSATPANTVMGELSRSIRSDEKLFQKISAGVYALWDYSTTESDPTEVQDEEENKPLGPVGAYGIHWVRSKYDWTNIPELNGQQIAGSKAVNFAEQTGVYILYENHRVRYVGKAGSKSLGRRLWQHTKDHLAGRWDRFSWFGFREAENDGTLAAPFENWSDDLLAKAIEAVLIEAMEPPLNRQRGEGLKAAEFLQAPVPKAQSSDGL